MMFSGLVETVGRVAQCQVLSGSTIVQIERPKLFDDLQVGDSIAVNGTCLSITEFDANFFSVQAVPETLRLTNLSDLTGGSLVNLERAVTASQRIGGHFVQGHVDACLAILACTPEGDAMNISFALPTALRPYVIHKGFVAIDGMSLTVTAVTETDFSVTLIPITREKTIANTYRVGGRVNFEVDLLAKYMENFKRYSL